MPPAIRVRRWTTRGEDRRSMSNFENTGSLTHCSTSSSVSASPSGPPASPTPPNVLPAAAIARAPQVAPQGQDPSTIPPMRRTP